MDSLVHSAANASSRATLAGALTARTRLVAALALVIASLPLVIANDYFYDVAITVALNAIVCIGLNLLIGYAGQISLGHAGFFALGGYGTALVATRYGWPTLAAFVAAVAAVALLAFIVGRPILRLKGHYLAMATLGLGIIVSIVISTEDRITGGPDVEYSGNCATRNFPPVYQAAADQTLAVLEALATRALDALEEPVGADVEADRYDREIDEVHSERSTKIANTTPPATASSPPRPMRPMPATCSAVCRTCSPPATLRCTP